MKCYAKYKQTGIAWLPQVPEHWNLLRGKNLYMKMQRTIRDTDEVVTCFRDGTVTLRKNRRTKGFTESLKEFGYQGIRKGDLVIHVMDAFAGSIGVSDSDGKGTPVYSVCQAKGDSNNYYYAFLLREMARAGFIQSLYRGIRERSSDFRYEVFASQFYPVPPREEQDQIVRFLDWKMARINKLIHDKRHQITQLEEMKKVCIKDAVTGKLSDAKNFKASGFEFIGQVPSHWMIIEIRRAYSVILGKMLASHPTSSQDTLEEYVCAKDVHFEGVALNELKQMWFSPLEKKQYQIQNGDLLVVEGGAGAGNAAIVKLQSEKTIYVQNSIHIVRPKNEKATNAFLCYWISSIVSRGYMKYVCSVATIPHYTKDKVLSTMMPLPPKSEQIQIVDYLDDICDKIDKATNIIKKQITELNDLKTHLISDVVTGKIDVRDIEIPEYESVEDVLDENTEDAEEEEMTAVEEE